MLSLSGLFGSFRKGSARRSAERALRGLSPAQLRDLGVEPDHIGELVDATLQRTQFEEQRAAQRSATPRSAALLPRRASGPAAASWQAPA